MTAFIHPAISMLAFFQSTQLNLFEQFLTQAVSGIDSTGVTAGMQNIAYVVLLVGFLWQVYQSALHGGDARGLGTSLIKYVVTAVIVMNYHIIFTTLNQGFVNAGNWINNASGGVNLLENWGNDLKTQWSQVSYQKMWGLITGSLAGLIDAILILIAFILYPVVTAIFGFFYILYGSILYLFGPIVIALLPLGAVNRLAKSYAENVFVWNAWPVLYAGFGALLSAVQMGQVGQMLGQNDFLGGLGSLEGSFLIGFASIIYSLAIAIIPFIAKKIVSGDVGATAAALIGAAATAVTAGVAATEGAVAGAAAAGGSAGSGAGASGIQSAHGPVFQANTSMGSNQPTPPQRAPNGGVTDSSRIGSDAPTKPSAASGGEIAEPVASNPKTSAFSDVNVTSGNSRLDGSPITAEAHAQQMRDDLQAVSGGSASPNSMTATRDEVPANDKAVNSSNGSSRSASVAGKVTRGSHGYGPGARRVGLATWGAYHAARLASYGAVAGGHAFTGTAGKVLDAAREPVETSGKVAGTAGRLAASLANAAVNTGRSVQTVSQALSNPSEAAAKGAQAISGTVSNAARQVATTAKGSMNEAKTQFSSAYSKKRHENERE